MRQLTYYSVIFPAELKLPEVWLKGNYDGSPIAVCVMNKMPALRIVDIGNGLSWTLDGENCSVSTKRPLLDRIVDPNIFAALRPRGSNLDPNRGLVIEYANYPHRTLFDETHTELVVGFCMRAECPDAPPDFFGKVLAWFIDWYRFVTQDVTVSRLDVIREKLVFYEAQEHHRTVLDGDPHDQLVSLTSIRWAIKTFTTSDRTESTPAAEEVMEAFAAAMKPNLASGQVVPEEYRLLLNAFDELVVRRNTTHPFLESIITAEVATAAALRRLQNSAPEAGRTRHREPSLQQMLEVDLPRRLQDLVEGERATLARVNELRRIRNDIVHRGMKVSEDDALDALRAVKRLLDLFASRGLLS